MIKTEKSGSGANLVTKVRLVTEERFIVDPSRVTNFGSSFGSLVVYWWSFSF